MSRCSVELPATLLLVDRVQPHCFFLALGTYAWELVAGLFMWLHMSQVCPYLLMEAPHTCGVGTVQATCVNCLVPLKAPTTVSLLRGIDTAVVLAAGESVGVRGSRAAEDLTQ